MRQALIMARRRVKTVSNSFGNSGALNRRPAISAVTAQLSGARAWTPTIFVHVFWRYASVSTDAINASPFLVSGVLLLRLMVRPSRS